VPGGGGGSRVFEREISRFGPPLFLKRDNRGNLNHRVVNEVLAEFFVLALRGFRTWQMDTFSIHAGIRAHKILQSQRSNLCSGTTPEAIGFPKPRGVVNQGDFDHPLPVASIDFLCLDCRPLGIQPPNGNFLHFIRSG